MDEFKARRVVDALRDRGVNAHLLRGTVEFGVRVTLPGGREAHITVSVGVATLPNNATDTTSLVEEADAALYSAKWTGRNRVCIAPTERAIGTARNV